jgi:hypothetical protein
MSNSFFLNLLAGLGSTAILFLILVPLIITIVILVWLHNISLNTHGIYMLLQDMHSEKFDDDNKTEVDNYEVADKSLQTLNLKGVFIGGDAKLVSELRKYPPNFAFISKDATSFNDSFVIGKDAVVICPDGMNNKLKVFTFSTLGKHNIEGEVIVHSDEAVESILQKIAEKHE